MTLFIKPRYYDFFSRSLVPYMHFWPISKQNMCEDIKYAVDWGNTHPEKVIYLESFSTNPPFFFTPEFSSLPL
jgi:protein glucosyltransferase